MSGLMLTFHANPVHSPKIPSGNIRRKTPVEAPERMLELARAGPSLTLAEIAKAIAKSLRAVERASAKLVKQGRLKHVGPRKGGRWEVLKCSRQVRAQNTAAQG